MNTEVTLDTGEVVLLEFDYEFASPDRAHGYRGGFFFYPKSYVPFDEDGNQMPSVDAGDMEVTDKMHADMEKAVREEWEEY